MLASHSCHDIQGGGRNIVLAGLEQRVPLIKTCISMQCAMRGADRNGPGNCSYPII